MDGKVPSKPLENESDLLIKAVEEEDLNTIQEILYRAGDNAGCLATTKGSHWYSALHTAAVTGILLC